MISDRLSGALIVVLGLALAMPVAAQDASNSASLRAANDAYYVAFSHKDVAAMTAIWAHEPWVSAVHPSSKEAVVGWENVSKGYALADWAEISLTQKDAVLHIDGNVGWVVGTETGRGRLASNGQAIELQSFVTNIFVKRGDKWLMVHHHANRPAGPPPSRSP